MPYKAWCLVCVAGEGIHNQSRQAREDEKERIGITVSMDYCFLTADGEADEDPKIMILHGDRLETLWTFGGKAKGVTPEVVTWIMIKLEEAGYTTTRTEITLKTDHEEAIMALKRAVAARRGARTTLINPGSEYQLRTDAWTGRFANGEASSGIRSYTLKARLGNISLLTTQWSPG